MKWILTIYLICNSLIVFSQTWYFHDTCYTISINNIDHLFCYDNYVHKLSRYGKTVGRDKIYWQYFVLDYGISACGTTKANVKHGLWIQYYLNGTKVIEGQFRNDKEHGEWKEYKCDRMDFRVYKNYKPFYVKSNYYSNGVFLYSKVRKSLLRRNKNKKID